MLRAFLIALSEARWAQRLVMHWRLAQRVANRFMAGEQPADAIRVASELNARGILVTLDHLGENTTSAAEAEQATADIVLMLDEIDRSGARANVSIKLSQIGLAQDKKLCADNLGRILTRARESGNFVRIDMEGSRTTDPILNQYQQMRRSGFNNVGVVIQSYLMRTPDDLAMLVQQQARVQLTKGAYREPREVAYPHKADVDKHYDRLVELMLAGALAGGAPLLSADGRTPPIAAIATHDLRRIEHAISYAHKIGLPRAALEFQMLYGIRSDLRDQLVAEGYPVRVYLPYGAHWYPYFMRRLAS